MSEFKFLGCLTADQLVSLLEEIDETFQKEGRPIPQRPLHAVLAVGKQADREIPIAAAGTRIEGSLVADGTWDFIEEWFEQRYGDRLKLDFSPGNGVILIRGDAYKFGIPRVYGTVHFICRSEEMGIRRPLVGVGPDSFPICNILNEIAGLTKPYALQLRNDELQAIWNSCLFIIKSYYDIENAVDKIKEKSAKELAKEALGDLRDGVEQIFKAQPRYGQTRWCALQSVEKMLKTYLLTKSIKYRYVHDLQELVELFGGGLSPIFYDATSVGTVQCAAAVRYGEQSSTLQEAVDAWRTALRMCGELAKQIRQDLGC